MIHARLNRLTRFCLAALMVPWLAGCAGDKPDVPEDKPVDELYNTALSSMDEREFKKAAQQFEEVERQHPYSQWATRAQLMAAFAQYQALDYDAAYAGLDQFIQMHPGNDQIAYAYYLKALTSYERLADVRRDQTYALNALKDLQNVVSRFPDTSYARDAVLKIALVNDHLAGAEMNIGRYYLKQRLYTAAIGRFRAVIEKYQTTSHVPEALHRLVECYLALGIVREAKMAAAVLGNNFPGSPWYQDSYDLLQSKGLTPETDEQSWIARAWNVF